MNSLSKPQKIPGDDIAAALGMSLGAALQPQEGHGHANRGPRGSSHRPCSNGDPVRAIVADKLAHMIHIGLLQAGDPLPSERHLCEVFRVARQSVRAALGILEGRLMLAISHGRRSRILGPGRLNDVDGARTLKGLRARDSSDIHQVFFVLDGEIASLSAASATAQELDEIDSLVAMLPELAQDPLCYLVLDYEIRALIYASCGNRLLSDIAMDFYGHASPQRRKLFADPDEVRRNSQLLASLAQGLRARDALEMARIMNEQARALAAVPLPAAGASEASTFRMNDAEKSVAPCTASTFTRGVFWPTAALAEA